MLQTPPLAYFITFACHGTHLPGACQQTVDRDQNRVGQAFVPLHQGLADYARRRSGGGTVELNGAMREAVLTSLKATAGHAGWLLVAAHVRCTHVHLVVQAPDLAPEAVMGRLKAHATRALVERHLVPAGTRLWARHGSTRYLWKPKDLVGAIRYVVEEQGPPMALWAAEEVQLEP